MNVKLIIQYDGTDFSGSQIQPGQRTVQSELENALEKLLGQRTVTVFSGRTDSGVHAKEQTVNFSLDGVAIPPDKIFSALNRFLPDDIMAVGSEEVFKDFNSRFSAKKRTYRYFIRRKHDLFRNRYSLLYPYDIDLEKLNSACRVFLGKMDFQAFCSARSDTKNYICEINELFFFRENDEVVMQISANRFLHNMVRIIVSVFLDLNTDRITEGEITEIISRKDRRLSPKTISPKGLFLWKVEY
ncbi:MAG: tRNA pseudouridine(38-40) synthase TruA [Candidatus Delongbacteria bacterium]|nr:tRNA pseudouridine(38-40) synthase TruA [Candidatus Delongbacteria bacterium]